ncbi:Permease MlaE [Loktanella atrilutea]|uniref:Permease MlaE n=1 Tax=Loktanella atrilutea TaxID=366533 RepID=A0A1M5FID8_LOKAT|nr:Permease MlaE [Loktanella atrilutea]
MPIGVKIACRLTSVVLAFRGSAQLHQFGAEIFVVYLISISVLRELGILLTAIIVAGRSGSAFTAAMGTMKMRGKSTPCAPSASIRSLCLSCRACWR